MSSESRPSRRLAGSLISVLAVLVVCASAAIAAPPSGSSAPRVIEAKKFVRVAPAGKEPVLLEGGAFGPGGDFYFVNALAPGGESNADGSDFRVDLAGKVNGRAMSPDDIAFDRQGNLFLTDSSGTPATNLGIEPGTEQGYIVVGGESGGFVYKFKALGRGISLAGGDAVGRGSGA